VPENATKDEVKLAFRKKALQYHPDKNAGQEAKAQAQFVKAKEAYNDLLGINKVQPAELVASVNRYVDTMEQSINQHFSEKIQDPTYKSAVFKDIQARMQTESTESVLEKTTVELLRAQEAERKFLRESEQVHTPRDKINAQKITQDEERAAKIAQDIVDAVLKVNALSEIQNAYFKKVGTIAGGSLLALATLYGLSQWGPSLFGSVVYIIRYNAIQ